MLLEPAWSSAWNGPICGRRSLPAQIHLKGASLCERSSGEEGKTDSGDVISRLLSGWRCLVREDVTLNCSATHSWTTSRTLWAAHRRSSGQCSWSWRHLLERCIPWRGPDLLQVKTPASAGGRFQGQTRTSGLLSILVVNRTRQFVTATKTIATVREAHEVGEEEALRKMEDDRERVVMVLRRKCRGGCRCRRGSRRPGVTRRPGVVVVPPRWRGREVNPLTVPVVISRLIWCYPNPAHCCSHGCRR